MSLISSFLTPSQPRNEYDTRCLRMACCGIRLHYISLEIVGKQITMSLMRQCTLEMNYHTGVIVSEYIKDVPSPGGT